MKIIDKELEKKKETNNVVKSAASNVYQTAFRHIINDMRSLPKVSDSHKKINSNNYMSNNSTNNMSESINSAKLNKIDKKEIVIQFLENRQVKNMIYDLVLTFSIYKVILLQSALYLFLMNSIFVIALP